MRQTRNIMGMPITLEVVDAADASLLEATFAYFEAVDRQFSTYKADSEISAINRGERDIFAFSPAMLEVLAIADQTRNQSDGYFDIRRPDGAIDPSGIVKGWAILNAARRLEAAGAQDFYVDAGGDIQAHGHNAQGSDWSVGIRHPFEPDRIVKVLFPRGKGIATSGNYVRGDHIYDPHSGARPADEIVSLTVIGPDVLEADRFATAAFAMGRAGIGFIENLPGFEAYLIDRQGVATMTSRFKDFTS